MTSYGRPSYSELQVKEDIKTIIPKKVNSFGRSPTSTRVVWIMKTFTLSYLKKHIHTNKESSNNLLFKIKKKYTCMQNTSICGKKMHLPYTNELNL